MSVSVRVSYLCGAKYLVAGGVWRGLQRMHWDSVEQQVLCEDITADITTVVAGMWQVTLWRNATWCLWSVMAGHMSRYY